MLATKHRANAGLGSCRHIIPVSSTPSYNYRSPNRAAHALLDRYTYNACGALPLATLATTLRNMPDQRLFASTIL